MGIYEINVDHGRYKKTYDCDHGNVCLEVLYASLAIARIDAWLCCCLSVQA